MSDDDETPEMGYDTLRLANRLAHTIGGSDASHGYDALRELAPMLSCWIYGHPNQPTWFLRRFKQRPWRCKRCGTWWITYWVDHPIRRGWNWTRVTEMD